MQFVEQSSINMVTNLCIIAATLKMPSAVHEITVTLGQSSH